MPSAAETSLRPWVLGLGSLALLLGSLLAGIGVLPEPWPRILAALLLTGLIFLMALMAGGSWVGTPLAVATWGERCLLGWVARFAADPGAFLYRWAEAAPSVDRARDRLQMAASRDHAPALRDLGRDLLEGAMGSTARGAGLPWLQRAADRGDAESAYWLGEALRWGIASVGNTGEAQRLYLQAARGGYRPAALWLARAFASGDGVAADEAQADLWARRAAGMAGSEVPGPGLLQRLADRSSPAAAVVSEFREAAGQMEAILWPQRWFRGVVWSVTLLMLALAMLYILVTPPLLLIFILVAAWLFLAAGLLRLYGMGPRKTNRGTRTLEDRARAGDPAACHELGQRFEQGHPDLPRDAGEARRWYRRAADAGHTRAAVQLADLLAWGLGGPKDTEEARRLLERAAALGTQDAHLRLRRMAPGFSATTAPADEAGGDGAP